MNQPSSRQDGKPDPKPGPNLADEADIGSGEKNPGQQETEELIRQIAPLPDDGDNEADDRREAGADSGADVERMEQEESLDKDEPDAELDQLDPVPPKGR